MKFRMSDWGAWLDVFRMHLVRVKISTLESNVGSMRMKYGSASIVLRFMGAL